ncbi:hypothetical protein GCM10020229_56610 [Kitasatospora albolonga]|uniref:hypothetical protein n=1 Tax=Kitasatospora albolonga TaxID=68173 RepID=UPI0031E5F80B
MSDTIGTPTTTPASTQFTKHVPVEVVHEAYSFACLSCGYGWEQGYRIEHHTARDGSTLIEYHANGVRVPSPLLKPTCPGCGGHTVRIMREGRVATAEHNWHSSPGYASHAEPERTVTRLPHRSFRTWLRSLFGRAA